jgi:hypothetical protein
MKKVLRKRNKLVQLAVRLKGEELKAVEFAIKLIDFMIDSSSTDDEQNGRPYVCIDYNVVYLDEFEKSIIDVSAEYPFVYAIDKNGKCLDEDLNEYRNEDGDCVYIPIMYWKNYKQLI